jgi:anti-sigma regulatory factor (Ser/Thr protein kinase)
MDRNHSISLSIPSDPACLSIVRAMVERVACLAGLEDAVVDRVILAVDEACTNIIRHQYGGRADERIDLRAAFDRDGRAIEFVLRDYGQVRDPRTFFGRQIEDVRPGGLGVHFIKEVMDDVEYSAAPGGGMQLRLTKAAGTK